MKSLLSPPPIVTALPVVALATVVACGAGDPVDVDDAQQRHQIEEQFNTIEQTARQEVTDVTGELDDALDDVRDTAPLDGE